jgi:hypothetical protein
MQVKAMRCRCGAYSFANQIIDHPAAMPIGGTGMRSLKFRSGLHLSVL